MSSLLQITNLSFSLHHLTCGISSLLHSVYLILFTLLLVHFTDTSLAHKYDRTKHSRLKIAIFLNPNPNPNPNPHFTLRLSPHHSHHLRSHHLSLPRSHSRPKAHLFLQTFSSIVFLVRLVSSGMPSRVFACTD